MINLLLVLGCVLGVIGGAAPSTARIGSFPTDWLLTIIGGVCLVSAFFLRRGKGAASEQADGAAATTVSMAEARSAVQSAPDRVRDVLSAASSAPMAELIQQIGIIIEKNLNPVIAAQEEIIKKQGFGVYAAHTGPWASGERMVYRAWSAATDGHRPEAVASLKEAILHFEDAAEHWPKNP